MVGTRKWKNGQLQDLVSFQRGFDITQAQQSPGPFPVISSSGVTSYHSEYKANGPGVVIGRKGTLGSVHYSEGDYWPHDTTLWSKDIQGNNPRFVYFYLHTVNLKRFDVGNSNPTLNRNHIHDLPALIPPIDTQQRIADILSAYDDLIENNRRRMALLEDAARQLYREWFVRLRFPGHEHTRIVDGVPEGWERVKLVELAEITMGQSPESKHYNEDGEGLPFHQGVTDFGDRFVTHRIYSTAMNRIAEPGDILCSVRAPVGRLNVTLDKIVIGRGLAALRSKNGHQSLLLHQLRAHFFKEDLIGGGAIFASVTKKEFSAQGLLEPPERLKRAFEDVTVPCDEQIRVLHLQNQKLRAARDLLLPRLMSGEVTA
ncbi:MAG: restriction endonuclease subunit S [Minisyncoccota bacterium]